MSEWPEESIRDIRGIFYHEKKKWRYKIWFSLYDRRSDIPYWISFLPDNIPKENETDDYFYQMFCC